MNDNNITYNNNANNYASTSKQGTPWLYFDKPSLDTFLKNIIKQDTKILELGCGGGKVIGYLVEKGASEKEITGVDNSNELLKIAKENYPNITFIDKDIRFLEPQEAKYNLILAVRVLEYLSLEDLHVVLKNCYLSLKPAGTLFFIVGHPIRVNGSNIATYQERGPRTHTIPGNIQIELMHKTLSDYINALIETGFTIDAVDETKANEALKEANPSDYSKYSSYGAVTFVVKATK